MDCLSWVLGGGWQGAMLYPAASEHTGDLGEAGGDPHWAFQPPAMNHIVESCHEGPVFVLDFSLGVGKRDAWTEIFFSYLTQYI